MFVGGEVGWGVGVGDGEGEGNGRISLGDGVGVGVGRGGRAGTFAPAGGVSSNTSLANTVAGVSNRINARNMDRNAFLAVTDSPPY